MLKKRVTMFEEPGEQMMMWYRYKREEDREQSPVEHLLRARRP